MKCRADTLTLIVFTKKFVALSDFHYGGVGIWHQLNMMKSPLPPNLLHQPVIEKKKRERHQNLLVCTSMGTSTMTNTSGFALLEHH
jgi:hypothetical protein